jgi:hypothetical protein
MQRPLTGDTTMTTGSPWSTDTEAEAADMAIRFAQGQGMLPSASRLV